MTPFENNEQQLAEALAGETGLVCVDPDDEWVDPELIRRLPRSFAERHKVLPLHRNRAGEVVVAMADPRDPELLRELESSFGLRIRPAVAPPSVIAQAIYRHYDLAPMARELLRGARPATEARVSVSLELDPSVVASRLRGGGTQPYVELYNYLLVNAIERRASDIHVEPEAERLRIRLRIDGLLREALELPTWAAPPLASRIKGLAAMDIADTRRPQDGKTSVKLGTRPIDLRVATMPGKYGEKLVVRLLDPAMTRTDLGRLGWATESLSAFYRMVSRPQGLVLVVGPTGSGKSTTLYATIQRLNSENTAIVTIEDPIEYEVAGVTQVQVNPKADVTFATAIRAALRQDPNVMVIGEVRDEETAKACVNAANTGHLVLSTLHTVNALGAIQRMIDLDVPPFMLGATLSGVVAQRLLRRVCPHCSIVESPSAEDWRRLGLPALSLGDKVRRVGPGCPSCQYAGYRGRVGVFELVTVTDAMRALLLDGFESQELFDRARADGMVTLFEDALEKVRQGVTTLEELARAVPIETRALSAERFATVEPDTEDAPAVPTAQAPAAESPISEPGPAPEILIVDDAEEILSMVEMALSDDYRVRKARDGVQALAEIRVAKPDLVVLDVMMPRLSGYEVCAQLKADPNTESLPVLMLSARGETAHIKQGLRAGADDYLPKPFDPEELLLRIRALLRRAGR